MQINIKHPFEKVIKEFYYKLKHFTSLRFKLIFFSIVFVLIFSFSFAIAFFIFVYPTPSNFPKEETISVQNGATLAEIATYFEKEGIVSSSFWLETIIRVFGNDTKIMAGKYFFAEEKNIFEMARSIISGSLEPKFVEIIIPEGATVMNVAQICENRIKSFDKSKFLSVALSKEGFLFPDTYYFPLGVGEEKILNIMNENFKDKMGDLKEKIGKSEHTLEEVVVMASLLEKEAITSENKRIIAGVLWKRLEIGMKLQVDAVFGYINGKNTFNLTFKDLAHNSPYNTYKYKGLPSGPIANPGLESIKAALSPAQTEYLFYLSDMQGNMHYSETYKEHMRKRNRYLN